MACCSCTNPAAPSCRAQIVSADLAELLYIQGLDVNLCTKFAAISELFQFRDCANNVIAIDTQIVTCAEYATQLCTALAALASGGSVELGVTEVVGSDCVTYTIPETVLVVTDSSSIDLTASGSFGHALTAVVKVSADAGNILVLHADGVYVPATSATTLAVADTSTIDMTIAGAAGSQTISSVAIVSPDAGNELVIHANGLYAPAETSLTVIDTNCINLNVSGAAAHTLQADIIISPVPGNIITCTAFGLYAPPTSATAIAGVDTNCIDMSVVEAPAGTFAISASPIISPTAGNQITCTANGLYVPNAAVPTCVALVALFTPLGTAPSGTRIFSTDCNSYILPTVVALDTSCINTTVANVGGNWQVSSVPIIDPDACNEVECRVGGMFVREGPRQNSSSLSIPTIIPAPILITAPDTFTVPSACIDIESISTCSPGIMMLNLVLPGYVYQPTIAPARVRASFTFTLDVPGGVGPTTETYVQTTEGNVVGGEIAVMQTTYNFLSYIDPAPATGQVCVSFEFEVLDGAVNIQAGFLGANYAVLSATT